MISLRKKIVSIIAFVAIFGVYVAVLPIQSQAAEEVTIQEMNELRDNAIQSRAVMMGMETAEDAVQITNKETGETLNIDAYISPEYKVIDSQNLFTFQKKTTPIVEPDCYAVDVVAEVTKGDLQALGANYTYEATDESWLSSGSVKLWGRFYYERNLNEVLVTRVTGNWANYEAGRQYISFQSAQASCCDEYNMWQVTDYSPNGGFTYDTGYTDYASTIETMMTRIGLAQHLEIQRYAGDGTYDLSLYVAPWGWNW